ncbi:MAG: F0F1 ATP synthase subunit A [Rhodospirillaceae bacterium]
MADAHSPITQFVIKPLIPLKVGGWDISFTNSAAFMTISIVAITLLMVLSMRGHALVPNRFQSIAEMSYMFIANLVRDTVGPEGRPYFPFVFSLFMFILFGNLLGMIPYSFTFTSHIIVTFAFAGFIFIGVTLIGIFKHKLHFLSFFLPPGVPVWMAPLLIPIEIISYLSRPVSLSVRLFANMMAGHLLLKVFAGFVIPLGLLGIMPLAFLVALTGLEIVIAFLQAFIFTILTCLYISDAIHLH